MKYLKEYNQYGDCEGFLEISIGEYNNYFHYQDIYYNLDKFTEEEKKQLIRFANQNELKILIDDSIIRFDPLMRVEKYADEWYIISNGDYEYFKCDQFDSVLRCLEGLYEE